MTNTDSSLMAGVWPGDARWEFFLGDNIPDPSLSTTAACVALRSLGAEQPDSTEVVLTYNSSGRGTASPGSWEMPGGHIDPLDPADPDGPKETPEQAVTRETLEEAGFVVASLALFGYRRVLNPKGSRYPEVSYTPFYWATTEQPLQPPTDPENPPPCGTFRLEALRRLAAVDALQIDELAIIEWGVQDAIRKARGSNAS